MSDRNIPSKTKVHRWRVRVNGTAYMGMYLINEDGSDGPQWRAGDSSHGYVTHEDAKALEAEIERLQRELEQMRSDWKSICDAADAMPPNEIERHLRLQCDRLRAALEEIVQHDPHPHAQYVARRALGVADETESSNG